MAGGEEGIQGQQKWTETYFKIVPMQRGRGANAPRQNWPPTGHLEEMGMYTTTTAGTLGPVG